ncbi:Clavaminate synthase-like protein [Colletotrichum viniferum]|nr:Clavaminate synthase-like protein [Colletotrichum viniferum]
MADVESAAAPQSGLPSSALENWGDIDKGLPLFEAFKVPGQQDTAKFGLSWSSSFPLGLKANKTLNLTESIEAVQRFTRSGDLIKLIGQHGGAALIRGLPIKTPDDYSGATPITSAICIAHELQRQSPQFLSDLLNKGVKYVYRYTVNPLVSNTGTSVRGAYGQEVTDGDDEETARRKIEAEVRRHSDRFEWHDDGSLSVTHIVPAIRIHTPTESTVFFGNVTSAWGRSRHHGATRRPFRGDDGSYHPPPTFGDGTPIDVEDLDLLLKLAKEGAVDVEWEQGDLVLLDNYAVMHSRKPWKGERQVLAALWDDDGRIRDFPEGVELLKGSPRVPRTDSGETVG